MASYQKYKNTKNGEFHMDSMERRPAIGDVTG